MMKNYEHALQKIQYNGGILFGERHVHRHTEVAVRRGIGCRRHKRSVHLMVEICSKSQTLAHHIVCREVDGERAGAACGLCQAGLDFSNQCVVAIERHIEVQRQVVVHILLLAFELEHGVEIGNLISGANLQRLLPVFYNLSCRGI